MMLAVTLRRSIRNGERRQATPKECSELVRCGTSVQPRYGKNWHLQRDDDGALTLLHTSRSGMDTWPVSSIFPGATLLRINIALSSSIPVGASRSPSIAELKAIFDEGAAVLPGSQLVRENASDLWLICGNSRWPVEASETVAKDMTQRTQRGRLATSNAYHGILTAMF